MISAITLSGWAETKQAYQFKKDLVEELKTDVQMDFCLRDLALPFLSFFLGNGAGILGNSITEMKAT